jgi:hypothetical protein
MAELDITVQHSIANITATTTRSLHIPPDYDTEDVKAFTAFQVMSTARQHDVEKVGREEVFKALEAGSARLEAIRKRLAVTTRNAQTAPLIDFVRHVLDIDNDQALAEFPEQGDDE